MQWWGWLLIVIAGCLLVCVIIFFTNSKQKNNQKLFEQDERLLQSMQGKLDYLIVLCGMYVEIKERLEGIQEKIKYFEPSKNALEQDKRITERIDDLKVDGFKSSFKRCVSFGFKTHRRTWTFDCRTFTIWK
mgnify:CR=1 FL=1